MKITIDVDCTPEEARTMLGLPDVKPMQEAMMAEMEERMRGAMESMDPESLMKTWVVPGMMPGMTEGGATGFEQMQKAFWSQMTGAMTAPKSSE
jgi:hypothetical protein